MQLAGALFSEPMERDEREALFRKSFTTPHIGACRLSEGQRLPFLTDNSTLPTQREGGGDELTAPRADLNQCGPARVKPTRRAAPPRAAPPTLPASRVAPLV